MGFLWFHSLDCLKLHMNSHVIILGPVLRRKWVHTRSVVSLVEKLPMWSVFLGFSEECLAITVFLTVFRQNRESLAVSKKQTPKCPTHISPIFPKFK